MEVSGPPESPVLLLSRRLGVSAKLIVCSEPSHYQHPIIH